MTRIITIFICSSILFAQSQVGTWFCQDYQVQLTLGSDGSYQMQHSGGLSQGVYQVQGNQLWMKDNSAYQSVGYYAAMPDGNHLNLTDGNGVMMSFVRKAENSAVAPSQMQNGERLASAQGLELFQGHVEVGIGLTEFILGHKVKVSEHQELKAKLIEEFRMAPQETIQQITEIDLALRRLATLQDPVQIGLARQQLYAALFLATAQMNEHEKPLLVQVLNRYIKVLASDPQNQLVLTQQDAMGMMNYLVFLNRCQGIEVQLNKAEQEQFIAEMAQQFQFLPAEQKQVLCCASLIWRTIESNWSNMNAAQRNQFMASMNQQMPAQGYGNANYGQSSHTQNSGTQKSMADMQADFNARQNMFQMMQNMNLNSHATSLNIIENMGGTGNYWEVTDQPYWMN